MNTTPELHGLSRKSTLKDAARHEAGHSFLSQAGWHVIVLWECEVKKRMEGLADEIRGAVQ